MGWHSEDSTGLVVKSVGQNHASVGEYRGLLVYDVLGFGIGFVFEVFAEEVGYREREGCFGLRGMVLSAFWS